MPTKQRSAAVAVRNLSVTFESSDGSAPHTVLHEATLNVQPGEFVVLVGRSGCGKTTLLNVLAGLIQPTSGAADVHSGDDRRSAQLSYMFARDALLPWRTAQSNVELLLELHGVDGEERRRRASSLLSSLGLAEAAQRYPWQLSQGMRQRVALSRTWALEPDLILMDEPFAALDAQTRAGVQRDFVDAWQKRRPTVVFVTHDITEAIVLADRVIVVRDGHLREEISIPFSRPRNLEDLLPDPTFLQIRKELNDALH